MKLSRDSTEKTSKEKRKKKKRKKQIERETSFISSEKSTQETEKERFKTGNNLIEKNFPFTSKEEASQLIEIQKILEGLVDSERSLLDCLSYIYVFKEDRELVSLLETLSLFKHDPKQSASVNIETTLNSLRVKSEMIWKYVIDAFLDVYFPEEGN